MDKAITEIDLSRATIKDLILVRNDIQNSLNDMDNLKHNEQTRYYTADEFREIKKEFRIKLG